MVSLLGVAGALRVVSDILRIVTICPVEVYGGVVELQLRELGCLVPGGIGLLQVMGGPYVVRIVSGSFLHGVGSIVLGHLVLRTGMRARYDH